MIQSHLKFFIFVLIIICFIVTSAICNLIIIIPYTKNSVLNKIISLYSKIILRILNVKCLVKGTASSEFIVSNHLSYLDILILSSISPSTFITSKEVEKQFFLGLLSKIAGTVFIERRNRSTLKEDILKINLLLYNKIPIILFPEGTSSNGDGVLPFKSSLFFCVENIGYSITPVCINYVEIDGEKISKENRDKVFYYGDIVFGEHVVELFKTKSIVVKVSFLEKVLPKSRKEMAREAFEKINYTYLKEKTI